jgi:hypothetical protein
MSYRVVIRSRVAENLDTVLFLSLENGRDVGPLRAAVREINRRLSRDPSTEGESRVENERVLIVSPLSALYEVFTEHRAVLIYSAVLYPAQKL